MAAKPGEKKGTQSGGKLPKDNTISVASLKPSSCFEGWATKQGGSHKSWKRRYFVLVVNSSANNKASADLYYFKTDKAKSATGVIKLNERSTVKEQNLKGKPCIAVDTGLIGVRTYYMYSATPAEQEKFVRSLNEKIQSIKSKPEPKPANNTGGGAANNAGGAANNAGGAAGGGGSTPAPSKPTANDGIKFALESAKNAIPFLGSEGGEDRILEFWQIWTESIPTGAPEVSVTLVTTADMSQLSWRVYGPQNVLIQEMVDFFWNVGAPEQEIDRLNDVGGLINPLTIGSWIDMSTKGGMDGGWVFPVIVNMPDALKACDEGAPLNKLSEWTKAQKIEECVTVGRDMGASPPRQTEVRFTVPGDSLDARLAVAISAYKEFGFPAIPEQYIATIKTWNPVSMELSVITSSEGFVRIGMILPNPDKNTVATLCQQQNGANSQTLLNFQQKMKIDRPAFAEFQFLMESFGYGVYNEGLNLVFHYNLDRNMV